MGGSERCNTARILTSTASPQENSTKHRHRKSAKETDEGKKKRPPHQIPLFFYLAHFSWCNPLTGADRNLT